MKRVLVLLALGLGIAAFFYLDLGELLSLSNLKAEQHAFETQYDASPIAVIGMFAALYIAASAASLPGMAILTLAAGALFGLVEGSLIVSFASSIGATLSFLASRYLFRDQVRRRFGGRLRSIDEGMHRDGGYYLFTLRLVPLFPFFLVNLLMGLTAIPVWTFYWVSQLGMLAGTIVYVNAGTQLARIDVLSDIVSPGIIASFAALGLFPWIARACSAWLRKRRLYGRWKKPKRFDRNLIVIGGGAAGLMSSFIGSALKASVALVEAGKMGGDCLNYGCVPSKALIRSARLAQHIREGERYGLDSTQPRLRFGEVMKRVRAVIQKIEPHDSIERYRGLGVAVIEGRARIADPWTVEIEHRDGGTDRLTTRAVIIAAGAAPFVPSLPGIEEMDYLTSDTLWEAFAGLDEAPARLLVLGGGPIGCELAQAFARLGSDVTLVERSKRLLEREDADVSALVEQSLEASGVTILTGHSALRFERHGAGKILIAEHEGSEQAIHFDTLLVAVGRAARLTGYGLEGLGIETGKVLPTDGFLQTVYPNIFAAGDVTGPYQFTHFAAHQAWYASVNALFGNIWKLKADYSLVPRTTFVDPEVAHVGLNEVEAQERGIAHEVTRFELRELDRAIADSATSGFVKLLTRPGTDRILGVTIVGEHAGDLLAEYVLAMKHGLGLKKVLGTIHSYPTMAEANKYAAGAWRKNHVPEGLLRLMERYHAWRRSGHFQADPDPIVTNRARQAN